MIKSLIFDLGNVIVPFDFQRGYLAMEPLCGYPAAEIPQRLRSSDLVSRFDCGQIQPEPFVKELCKMLDLKITYTQFVDLWTCIFTAETLLPESLFASLKQRYRLVLLSNTNEVHFEMLERTYPILRHFDERVLSYRVGAAKPSPVIYREAITRAQCQPAECFFTDDIQSFVDAAKNEGIDAVQFISREQLETELTARGITW